jgi:hypothetical protein
MKANPALSRHTLLTKEEITNMVRRNTYVSAMFAHDFEGHNNKCCVTFIMLLYKHLLYFIRFTFPALISGRQQKGQSCWGITSECSQPWPT